jgi:hypothetical protein
MLLRTSSALIILKVISRRNHRLINHKLYPLHDRESTAYNQLILNSRQEFLSTGCLYLPDFLTTPTLSTILQETNSILNNSSETLFDSYVQHTENLYKTSTSEYSWNPLIDFITDIIQIYP